jgi:hypothetical protein
LLFWFPLALERQHVPNFRDPLGATNGVALVKFSNTAYVRGVDSPGSPAFPCS